MKKLFFIGLLIPSLGWTRGPSDPLPTGYQLAPSTNVWFADISSAPVSASSTTLWIDVINGHAGHNFHANFGTTSGGIWNGIPYNLVWSSATPRVPVTLGIYATESDTAPAGGVPVPNDVIFEGSVPGSSTTTGGDSHLLLVDVSSGMIYELGVASRVLNSPNITANQLTIWYSTSNAMRTPGFTSADASGMSMTDGLLRFDEVSPTCKINHAIRMEVTLTELNKHIWPASHDTSSGGTLNPPFGMRVRMKASVDTSVLSDTTSICIFNAVKKYGMILADNGGDWYIDGMPNPGWNDTTLHDDFINIGLPLNTMEVIDESTYQATANSYQFLTPGVAPTITSALSVSAIAKAPFTYQITASNNPTSFGVLSLPGWLSFNSATGVMSGTPPLPQVNTMTIQATNGAGTGSATLVITVFASPGISISGAVKIQGTVKLGSGP